MDDLRSALWGSFKTGDFVDVSIECADDTTLKVHKIVLCAQSPVFKAMLQNDCKESAESVIRLRDDDARAVKFALYWCYLGNTPAVVRENGLPPDEFAWFTRTANIFAFADKYAMDKLREEMLTLYQYGIFLTDRTLREMEKLEDGTLADTDVSNEIWFDVIDSFGIISKSTVSGSDDSMRKMVVEATHRYSMYFCKKGPEAIENHMRSLLDSDEELCKEVLWYTFRNAFASCGTCYNAMPGHLSALTCSACREYKSMQEEKISPDK